MNTIRFLRVLSLVIWLGGIIFFSLAVAPHVFAVLGPVAGGSYLAGEIVARALHALHVMGIACGVLLLVCSATLHKTFLRAEIYFVVIMLALTAASQFVIMPRMEQMRSHPGFETRTDFDRLHRLSVFAEGGVLLLGVVVVWLVAGNRSNRPYRS